MKSVSRSGICAHELRLWNRQEGGDRSGPDATSQHFLTTSPLNDIARLSRSVHLDLRWYVSSLHRALRTIVYNTFEDHNFCATDEVVLFPEMVSSWRS
jgi:hypothetical protein